MALGEKLCNARLAKKMTTSQVATATRMKVQTVECLEKEDFRRIAAPIYAKGFIRMYAECVGLDPKPLIEEYMSRFGAQRGEQRGAAALEVDGQPRVDKLLKGAGPAPEAPEPSTLPPERDLFDFAPATGEPPVTLPAPPAAEPLANEARPPKRASRLANVVPKIGLGGGQPLAKSDASAMPKWRTALRRFPVWQRAAACAAVAIALAFAIMAARSCRPAPGATPPDSAATAKPEALRLATDPPEPYAD